MWGNLADFGGSRNLKFPLSIFVEGFSTSGFLRVIPVLQMFHLALAQINRPKLISSSSSGQNRSMFLICWANPGV